jgi:hypothetical protein
MCRCRRPSARAWRASRPRCCSGCCSGRRTSDLKNRRDAGVRERRRRACSGSCSPFRRGPPGKWPSRAGRGGCRSAGVADPRGLQIRGGRITSLSNETPVRCGLSLVKPRRRGRSHLRAEIRKLRIRALTHVSACFYQEIAPCFRSFSRLPIGREGAPAQRRHPTQTAPPELCTARAAQCQALHGTCRARFFGECRSEGGSIESDSGNGLARILRGARHVPVSARHCTARAVHGL